MCGLSRLERHRAVAIRCGKLAVRYEATVLGVAIDDRRRGVRVVTASIRRLIDGQDIDHDEIVVAVRPHLVAGESA
jgi:hypothetical protein